MALLSKFANMREELSRLATQIVMLLVSAGIECHHGPRGRPACGWSLGAFFFWADAQGHFQEW